MAAGPGPIGGSIGGHPIGGVVTPGVGTPPAVTYDTAWQASWSGAVRRVGVFAVVATGLVYALPPPAAATTGWLQPLSRAAQRPAARTALYTPFVPKEATLDNTPPEGWDLTLDGYGRFPRRLLSLPGGQPFIPREATVDNTVAKGWMQPFYKAVPSPNIFGKPYQPFVPREATSENTGTVTTWLLRWQGPPQRYKPVHTQPVFSYPPVVSNLTTTLEWMTAWPVAAKQPPLPRQEYVTKLPSVTAVADTINAVATVTSGQVFSRTLFYQSVAKPPYIPAEDNTGTVATWLQQWRGPPRLWPIKVQSPPFVPREATSENTITGIAWHRQLDRAAPRPPVWVTQPFFGYPYEGVDNTRIEWDWTIAWQGPPRFWPLGKPYQPFVPAEATVQNTVTPEKWMGRTWQGPPRITPIKVQTPPFVPREATVDNTVTPDAWLARWQKAVPRPPAWATQPFYGYPYEAAVTEVRVDHWLVRWQGPPRYRPPKILAQPFVPRAATAENTVTPEKWVIRWPNAPRYLPPKLHAQPFVPREETVQNTVTPEKWLFRFAKATDPRLPRITQPIYPVRRLGAATFTQTVTASITVEFHRMLLYSCKAEATDESVEQAEQSDPWSTQSEQVVSFSDQNEQADPWSTETEQVDTSEEEEEETGSGCP